MSQARPRRSVAFLRLQATVMISADCHASHTSAARQLCAGDLPHLRPVLRSQTPMDVEDALDEIGGLGKYQVRILDCLHAQRCCSRTCFATGGLGVNCGVLSNRRCTSLMVSLRRRSSISLCSGCSGSATPAPSSLSSPTLPGAPPSRCLFLHNGHFVHCRLWSSLPPTRRRITRAAAGADCS